MTLAMQMLLGTGEGETIGGLLPPPAEDGNAGISVSVSLSEVSLNRRLAIGAPGFEDGVVFIYEAPIGTGNFQFLTTVPSSSAQPDSEFGGAVALSDDGLKLIVGAPNEVGGGLVHTFTWDGDKYQKDPGAPLDSGDVFAGADARFGQTLAIDKSGTTIIVGAPRAQANVGFVYTYVATGDAPPQTQWVQLAGKLAGEFFAGNFGTSLDMGFGGLNAIVTQPAGSLNPQLVFFDRPDTGSQFILRQSSNITGGAASCALDDNGQLAFVGGRVGTFLNQLESYGQIGNLTWTGRGVLVGIPGGSPNYAFSMAASGDRLVVGDINGGGRVIIYSFQLNGNMAFMQTDFAPFGQSEAKFGFALKVNNAPLYVAGEPDRDRSGFEDAGNVYVLPVPT